ncbi:cryptochrome/photolyase family protein [Mycetocola spongiae]|uniref:cryptochrome/photolyase family protein n=1 Tax=Mycetocola spongiae TaxID=2859226 RepID=UPI001CF5909A|nr:deoxyribodipyrimidine photo-lyase [Mycetocola spongiae]UCR88010.1 DNA photolyase family protein [Mycetocola spongiae]
MGPVTLLWFRKDLRVSDNPALTEAIRRGGPVVALYLDESAPGAPASAADEPYPEALRGLRYTPGDAPRTPGGASRWWLEGSLRALRAELEQLNIPLILRRGEAVQIVPELCAALGCSGVAWNRRYGAAEARIDAAVAAALSAAGIASREYSAHLLLEPEVLRTGEGRPYSVFTPFWRRAREELSAHPPRTPLPVPPPVVGPAPRVTGDALEDWGLRPSRPDWASGWEDIWSPGERGARERLEDFLDERVAAYRVDRDRPARAGTSRLSAHLAFGEISPHQVWEAVEHHRRAHPGEGTEFLTEIGWREFAHYQLTHFPDLAVRNWRPSFARFPWPEVDPELLRAWQTGTTGVPIVDAGMRELWQTGTMHNRVRMIVASFLTKNLLIHWRHGEEWFWDTLVDADPAANAFNWQWVAGSGADAAPYFRIFNPELQRQKFDPNEAYLRRWLPEWDAGLRTPPIVDLRASREAALAAYRESREPAEPTT